MMTADTPAFSIVAMLYTKCSSIGQEDAMKRALAYVNAGADGIMIHSKESTPEETLHLCDYLIGSHSIVDQIPKEHRPVGAVLSGSCCVPPTL